MLWVLFLCFLTSIPNLIIAYKGKSYELTTMETVNPAAMFSLGNVGESKRQSARIDISDMLSGINYISPSFSCELNHETHKHQFELIKFIGVVPRNYTFEEGTVPNITYTPHDQFQSCSSLVDVIQNTFNYNCYDEYNCSLDITRVSIPNKCIEVLEEISKGENPHDILLTFQCNRIYTYFGFSIPKCFIAYVWVGCDMIIITSLAVYLHYLNICEKKDMKRIKKTRITADSFTVQIRNLPEIPANELYGELFQHFENMSPMTKVADIGIGLADKILSLHMEECDLQKKKTMSMNKRAVLEKMKSPDYKQIEKLKVEEAKMEEKIEKLNEVILENERITKKAKVAFVTFVDREGVKFVLHHTEKFTNRNFILRWFRKNKIKRFLYSTLSHSHLLWDFSAFAEKTDSTVDGSIFSQQTNQKTSIVSHTLTLPNFRANQVYFQTSEPLP